MPSGKETIAVFGGSFNPPHLAHVLTLAVVLGGGLALVLIGVAGGAAVYPLTVMFAVFATLPHSYAVCLTMYL